MIICSRYINNKSIFIITLRAYNNNHTNNHNPSFGLCKDITIFTEQNYLNH